MDVINTTKYEEVKVHCTHGREDFGKGSPCRGRSTVSTNNFNGCSKLLKIRNGTSVAGPVQFLCVKL